MAIGASPYQSVPNGIAFPATPPSPQDAAAMSGQLGVVPPGAHMTPPGAMQPQMGMEDQKPDLFQRVAFMMMDPETKQINPMIAMLFAGVGLARVLEKSGKQENLSHKSNEEQAAAGMPTQNSGQTSIKDPEQMAKGIGGMPGF